VLSKIKEWMTVGHVFWVVIIGLGSGFAAYGRIDALVAEHERRLNASDTVVREDLRELRHEMNARFDKLERRGK